MLKISSIRENKEEIISKLKKRKFKKYYLVKEIFLLDQKIKKLKIFLNKILEKENILSKKIGLLIKNKDYKKKIEFFKEKSFYLKKKRKKTNNILKNIVCLLNKKLIDLPNIPDRNVNEENKVIFQEGEIKSYVNEPLPHWELSKKFNLFDMKLGSDICGSGFVVYLDKFAKLQRSLIQYFLDKNTQASYKEYSLPYFINEYSGFSTGQIPDKEKQMYFLEKDNLYLIPTGEIPLMNCYRNKIFLEKDLPIKATTYTSCFRKEAGSYGTKVRGLNRLHQFEKVEIIQITHPKLSNKSLNEMIIHVRNILRSLKLPFRLIRLNLSSLGYSSSITYDFEVYSIAQKKWLEVSSISNCTDFQSNRLNIKYKNNNNKKINYCHTLNASSLALPRILVSLIENNQMKDSIFIPKVLIPYTGFENITI